MVTVTAISLHLRRSSITLRAPSPDKEKELERRASTLLPVKRLHGAETSATLDKRGQHPLACEKSTSHRSLGNIWHKKTRRRSIEEEMTTAEGTYGAVKRVEQNRVLWRAVTGALCSIYKESKGMSQVNSAGRPVLCGQCKDWMPRSPFCSRLCPSTAGRSPHPESSILLSPLLSSSVPFPVAPQKSEALYNKD